MGIVKLDLTDAMKWEIMKRSAELTQRRISKKRYEERRRIKHMKSVGGACPELSELKRKMEGSK